MHCKQETIQLLVRATLVQRGMVLDGPNGLAANLV